jgi:hypothetical protein
MERKWMVLLLAALALWGAIALSGSAALGGAEEATVIFGVS